jgi:hypothetical protein
LGIGQLLSWNDLPDSRVWRRRRRRLYAWKMPERSAVAVVVRLVGWSQLEERVCVQTSVNTRVVARLGYKYQMPDTWNSEDALEESEMDKAAAAVGLGSVPTTAQQRRVTSTVDRTSGKARGRCRSGGLEAAYLESLITWASTGMAGAARARDVDLARVGSQCSGANAMRTEWTSGTCPSGQ